MAAAKVLADGFEVDHDLEVQLCDVLFVGGCIVSDIKQCRVFVHFLDRAGKGLFHVFFDLAFKRVAKMNIFLVQYDQILSSVD